MEAVMQFIKVYAKSILAVVATALTALVGALTDGNMTDREWLNVAVAAVTAAAVFAAPNVPGAKYTKGILAVLGAGLAFLTSAIIGGITSAELAQLGVVVLGALGVIGVANKPDPNNPDLHPDGDVIGYEPDEFDVPDPDAFPPGEDGDLPAAANH